MKKPRCSLFCLLGTFSLSACQDEDVPVPTIRPAVFSEDAQALLDLLRDHDEDLVFFDYTINETIQSVSTDVWKHEAGDRVSFGHTSGNVEPGEYRMGFRLTESSYDIFDIRESGSSIYSYNGTAAFGTGATRIHRLSDAADIVCGEEITLWTKLGVEGNEIRTTADFRQADCTAGLAVTITFSDETLS